MSAVLDKFNRANGPVGNAETGQAWEGVQWVVDGNKIRKTGGTNGSWSGSELGIDVGATDAWIEAKITNSPVYVALFLRGNVGGGANYLVMPDGAGIHLYGSVGSYNYGLAATWPVPTVAGDRIGARVKGSGDFAVFKNDVLVGTHAYSSQPSLAANTRFGVMAYYSNVVGYSSFDDVSIKLPSAKVWDGSSWQPRYTKTYDGSIWKPRLVRKWNGSNWV